jgi:predicted ABC-type transport system involved in lysophospholipase L1 biosynthesis ATPase subunit
MIADAGQTIVMVTHDPSFAARARRMISMDDGQIISDQTRT